MLRLAHLSDLHLDERNRLDDAVTVLRAFLDQARDASVDLILIAGDMFERRSSVAERNALADFLLAAAEFAPVFGVTGNHDVAGDLDVFSRLGGDGHWPITIHDRPGSHHYVTKGVSCLSLPWFSKAHLCASLPPDRASTETTAATIEAARSLLVGLRAEAQRVAAAGGIPILAAHVQVAGAETSTGQTLIGQTVELAPSELADIGCAYVALGHIHRPQSWHGGRVAYSGSIQRLNFGEPEPKGWNLVEINEQHWREPDGVTVEFRELPARRIVLLESDWSGDARVALMAHWADDVRDGDLVRLRYRISPERLHEVDEAEFARVLTRCGAHSVKLEPILVHETRVRSTAIVEARDTKDRVRAYWIAKGIEVAMEQQSRVWAKLEAIEATERKVEVAA